MGMTTYTYVMDNAWHAARERLALLEVDGASLGTGGSP